MTKETASVQEGSSVESVLCRTFIGLPDDILGHTGTQNTTFCFWE